MLALLPLLLQIVPSIATLVAGGKQGGVLDAAAKVARDVLGTDDPAEVEAKLADPATAEAFKARLEAETAQMQALLADVANARGTMVQLVQEHSAIVWGPVVTSLVVLVIVMLALVGVATARLQEGGTFVGWALASGSTVLAYWLGSSNGSKRMGDAVRNIAERASVGQVADAVRRAVR